MIFESHKATIKSSVNRMIDRGALEPTLHELGYE